MSVSTPGRWRGCVRAPEGFRVDGWRCASRSAGPSERRRWLRNVLNYPLGIDIFDIFPMRRQWRRQPDVGKHAGSDRRAGNPSDTDGSTSVEASAGCRLCTQWRGSAALRIADHRRRGHGIHGGHACVDGDARTETHNDVAPRG